MSDIKNYLHFMNTICPVPLEIGGKNNLKQNLRDPFVIH